MSPSLSRSWLSAILGLATAGLFQGCLNYDESATLKADGSGELRVAFGVGPNGKIDRTRLANIRQSIDSSVGLKWIHAIDSTAGDVHWAGGMVHFDSLPALAPLNQLLPLRDLFGDLAKTDSAGVSKLRRHVRLLPSTKGMPAQGTFAWTVTWTLPGQILSSDSLGKWERGSRTVRWDLPTDGSLENGADLEVAWSAGSGSARTPFPAWSLVAIFGLCLTAGVAAFLMLRKRAPKE